MVITDTSRVSREERKGGKRMGAGEGSGKGGTDRWRRSVGGYDARRRVSFLIIVAAGFRQYAATPLVRRPIFRPLISPAFFASTITARRF